MGRSKHVPSPKGTGARNPKSGVRRDGAGAALRGPDFGVLSGTRWTPSGSTAPASCPGPPGAAKPLVGTGTIVPSGFAWQVQACGAILQPAAPPPTPQKGLPPPPCEKRPPVPSFPMKKRRSLRIA